MKVKIVICVIAALFVFSGASPWEGAAAVAPEGELPVTGRYVATNSFPVNTIVDITNIENNRSTRAIVANNLNSPGLLAVVSIEAAELIGMRPGSVSRIRMVQPSDPIAYLRFTEGINAHIPEYDSGNVMTEEQLLNEVYGTDTYRPSSGVNGGSGVAQADGVRGPSYLLEPEWSGGRRIIDLPGYVEYPPIEPTQPPVNGIPQTAQPPAGETPRTPVGETPPYVTQIPGQTVEPVNGTPGVNEQSQSEVIKDIAEKIDETPNGEVIKDIPAYIAEVLINEAEKDIPGYIAEVPVNEAEKEIAEKINEVSREEVDKDPGQYVLVPWEERLPESNPNIDLSGLFPEVASAQPQSPAVVPDSTSPASTPPAPFPEVTSAQPQSPTVVPDSTPSAPFPEVTSAQPQRPAVVPDSTPPAPFPEVTSAQPQRPAVVPDSTPSAPLPEVTATLSQRPAVVTASTYPLLVRYQKNELERGRYYVQLTSVNSPESVELAINQMNRQTNGMFESYKPVVYKDSDNWYRILLGSFNQGESAAVLQRFKSIGFSTAFVRRGS